MSQALFHKFLDVLKAENVQDLNLLVGVSGGVDSIVLLDLLKKVSSIQNFELFSVSIHHGLSSDPEIHFYRDQAHQHVLDFSRSLHIPCFSVDPPQQELKSEQEFRSFRYKNFYELIQKHELDFIALGHNSDDLLETRLVHLLRGCGSKGFQSMKPVSKPLLRPLLLFSRSEILEYAQKNKLKWVEDPSNQNNHFLRNWIRNDWLAKLEKKRAGSRFRLGQSLSQIALSCSQNQDDLTSLITPQGISRSSLRELALGDQKRLLALYMRLKNVKNYGQSHIEELIKHLNRKEKSIQVHLLKKTWVMDSQFLFMKD